MRVNRKTAPDGPRSVPALQQLDAYDVKTFCGLHSISRAHLYDLWKEGSGPRVMRAGRKILISREAAADWRALLERESER